MRPVWTKALALGLSCMLLLAPAAAMGASAGTTITPTSDGGVEILVPEVPTVAAGKPAPVLVIASYKTSTKRVLIGSRFKLTLEIDNATARKADNVVVSLQSGTSPASVAEAAAGGGSGGGITVVGSGNAKFLGTIKGSASDSVTFDVMVSPGTAAGTYTVPVIMAFEHNGERQEITQTIGIVVERDARFSMVLAELPDEVMAGETFDASFEVANTSGFALAAVSLSVEATDAVVADSNIFLGSFDAASSEAIDVQITAEKPGTLEVVLVVTYRDDFGKEKSFRSPYEVKVTDAPEEPAGEAEAPAEEDDGGNWFTDFLKALFGFGS